ncbi:type I-E CRISPR-associated protein Cse1/CasA [Mobiluncus curtisii]|uniref:Type I-E CRISPR-associated protein Cse1/CasA n=1 Tax=Mobiluncus curtisii TaxID=2051 RepID=A0A7Y0UG21_9ACTO|nr:type I-E CRISPR-associated protein Cse1/CasA [Mobiluncus curtisii]EFL93068.1 CRISPR system CASCADE complex protein CasA [Mobiluncus curtisii subsp. curtisii ATCC 35241]MCU9986925.1 type I-E CRISPR-associated protein Cse1/CasA [Mobiluncus curtisii]MCU9999825.1 type I-E CRISPR-associated protein Cse1/CasA [Mobiluncus curtisii]NMW44227.1 type I-E CRISPR-associated protein Cse1/CasA [Mobiluncus curtisii]NMW44952.1 type I-E CRISPR-associated protein Cse1/CasA [Mobiluncus curtisii]
MFSLIDDPWILVVDTDGNQRTVGIREIFAGEVKVASLQGESPAQNYAIVRLLLAIFWRAHSRESKVDPGKTFNFAAWFQRLRAQLQRDGRDDAVLDYLEHYRDRFELLDSPTPFMQVADLSVPSGELKHVTTIVPEAQEDYFTMRAGKARDSLSYAEAARWLVYAQAYDYSGIKSGAVGDSRVKGGKGYPIGTGWTGMTGGVLVVGENLLDTLILNTCSSALTIPQDKPVWERQPDGSDTREKVGENAYPQGPSDLLTWQSRRIRLHSEGNRVTGVILSNGDKIPDAGANVFGDPMTPYRYSTNKSKKNMDIYYPATFSPQRTVWRALDALIVAETDGGFNGKVKAPKRPQNLDNLANLSQYIDGIPSVLNVDLVAVEYGPQSSSVASTYAAQMGMPLVLLLEQSGQLRQAVRDAASVTSEAAIGLGRFAANLLVAAGKEYEFTPAPTDQVLAELEPLFNAWLQNLANFVSEIVSGNGDDTENDIVRLVQDWQSKVREIIVSQALILLRGAGPKAMVGKIVTDSNGEGTKKVVSAGTYYQKLQRYLDQVLPLTSKQYKNEIEQERKVNHE